MTIPTPLLVLLSAALAALTAAAGAQPTYRDSADRVRVALAKQPLAPNGPSKGPTTMAEGGIRPMLEGATGRALHGMRLEASAIGFATIPPTDEGGLSIAALNRMIAAAVRGVAARKR